MSRSSFGLWGIALAIIAGCGSEPMSQQSRLIPMREFFRNPEQTSYQLSPDGHHLAFLSPWMDRLNVHVQKVGDSMASRVTADSTRDILGYAWINNNRLVYIQDQGGNENYHAFAVDLDGSNLMDLTPFEGVKVDIIDRLEEIDDEMLIAMNRRDPRLFDVYRINVRTGEMEMIGENPGNISAWIADNAGHLRLAVTTDGVNTSILHRKTEADPFETIVTTDFRETIEPLFFTFDDERLYVSSNIGRDKQAIFEYDLESGKNLDMIYEHPEVDVASLMRSKARKVITGVAFYTDRRGYHFFDDERKALQESLEAQLPGSEVAVASMSRDERKVLVRTYTDKSLGSYYHYDLDTGVLTKLAEVSPWLKVNELSDMRPVQYPARDGLTIHGYLTIPRGVEPVNLPTVLLVHGGPWHRDTWGFQPEVQFLANRGYAVFQINFRGSTGYGKEFWKASFKQWGRAMQDDLTDGVEWLVEQGIADRDRVGIYGGSYGGYATLAGLAFTPDLYACGVDYVGVSNLFTFMDAIPPYWDLYRSMLYEMVGNPEEETELLRAASPYFHADSIQVPLFVAQGANDPRVNKAESDQIVEALRGRGIDVGYMVKENEGHGFLNEENRFDFYGAMERFLAQHLGGRAEETVSE